MRIRIFLFKPTIMAWVPSTDWAQRLPTLDELQQWKIRMNRLGQRIKIEIIQEEIPRDN